MKKALWLSAALALIIAAPALGQDTEARLRAKGYRACAEVQLPPATQPVMSGQTQSMTTLPVPAKWSYVPPRTPGVAAATAPAKTSPRVIPLPQINGGWPRAIYSTPAPKFVVIDEDASATSMSGLKTVHIYPPTVLRVYNLATGAQVGRLTLPPSSRAVALSGDGSLVLVLWAWRQIRLDLYDVKTGKHVVGWQPYPQDEENPQQPGESDEKSSLDWARFVDNSRVVTYSKNDLLTMWKLPTCERIYQFSNTTLNMNPTPCITADGAAVVLDSGALFQFSDARMLGQLASHEKMLRNYAVSPDGTRLAASKFLIDSSKLVIWDLASGLRISEQTEQPGNSIGRVWCSEGYFLERGLLKELQNGRYLWDYEYYMDLRDPAVSDGRTWVLVKGPKSSSLIGLFVPDTATLAAIKQGMARLPDALVGPGKTVKLEINIGAGPADIKTYADEVRAGLTKRLKENQLTVADDGELTLRISTTDGNQHKFLVFGKGEVSVTGVRCVRTWCNSKGEVLWTSDIDHGPSLPQVPADQDPAQFLRNSLWPMIKPSLMGEYMPMVVYPRQTPGSNGKPVVLGESIVTETGDLKPRQTAAGSPKPAVGASPRATTPPGPRR